MLLFKRIAFHVSAFDRCLGNLHQINHHEVGANAIEVADSPNQKNYQHWTVPLSGPMFVVMLSRFPLTTSQFQAWLHLWNPLMLAFALAPMFQARWVARTTLSWSRASFDCWLHRNQDWSVQACNGKMWRCFCIHTYTHTYIHTYVHTYIHTYTHTYIHACIQTHKHTYTHIHTCMHFLHTYIHTYILTYILTYIHTYRHTDIHACIQTHKHTCMHFLHTYILTYILTYIHTYRHTDIQTYIHTHIHTYIHT